VRTYTFIAGLSVLFVLGGAAANPAWNPIRFPGVLPPAGPPDHAAAPALKPLAKGKAPASSYPKDLVERGRILVMSGSCNDCHTPWAYNEKLGAPGPDWSRMLSGHPSDGVDPSGELGPGDIGLIGPTFTSFKLPFGVTYAMNLTPDIDTGTGSWTEQMFIDIFRKGRHLGGNGRPVYPPMPWHYMRYLSDDDLKAIFAYLRSVPPLRNMVPTEKIPPPVMDMVIGLNEKIIALQKDPTTRFEPPAGVPEPPPIALKEVQPGKGPGRKYPAALVKKGELFVTAGLCNDCHTPWKFNREMGAPSPDFTRLLSGHPEGAPDPRGKLGAGDMAIIGPTFTSFALPFGVAYSMNLTPDIETGIGAWTEEQFVALFRTGKHPDGRAVVPPMPWAMIAYRSDEDLKAMFAYLQSIPPIRNKVPAPKIAPEVLTGIAKTNQALASEKIAPGGAGGR
jgi:hypothetical protein